MGWRLIRRLTGTQVVWGLTRPFPDTLSFFVRSCNPPSQLCICYVAIPLLLYNQTSSGQPVKNSQSRHDRHLFPQSIPDERHSARPREPSSRLSPHNYRPSGYWFPSAYSAAAAFSPLHSPSRIRMVPATRSCSESI